MKIFIASDHAGVEVKTALLDEWREGILRSHGDEVVDLGTVEASESVHYPDFASNLVRNVLRFAPLARGVLICGTGIGMSIVANRYRGIRAALCCRPEEARMARQHNDANVLCLGARGHKYENLLETVRVWREVGFEGGRHAHRLSLFESLGS